MSRRSREIPGFSGSFYFPFHIIAPDIPTKSNLIFPQNCSCCPEKPICSSKFSSGAAYYMPQTGFFAAWPGIWRPGRTIRKRVLLSDMVKNIEINTITFMIYRKYHIIIKIIN